MTLKKKLKFIQFNKVYCRLEKIVEYLNNKADTTSLANITTLIVQLNYLEIKNVTTYRVLARNHKHFTLSRLNLKTKMIFCNYTILN